MREANERARLRSDHLRAPGSAACPERVGPDLIRRPASNRLAEPKRPVARYIGSGLGQHRAEDLERLVKCLP